MTPAGNRSLALAILAMIIVAVVGGAALGYRAVARMQTATIEAHLGELEQLARINARRPELEAELTALRARQAGPRAVFEEASADLSAAALQSRVKRLAEQCGAELSSTQVTGTRDERPFQHFGLHLRMTGEIGALQRLLKLLANERPYVFVDALSVVAKSDGADRPDARYEPVPLTWTISIHAYRRPA